MYLNNFKLLIMSTHSSNINYQYHTFYSILFYLHALLQLHLVIKESVIYLTKESGVAALSVNH